MIFADRPLDHARHHLLGVQARQQRGRLLRRGPPDHRPPERPRDLRRLPVGRVVPRHRRPDLPLRLRRVPVLDRVPRRVPHGDVPAGRADAQRGQVHDRRRARRSASTRRRRAPPRRSARSPSSTFYLIAQMVGAGVLIQALVGIDFTLAGDPHRHRSCSVYVIFGGMVATTWVQIIKAVLLMAGIVVMSVFVLGEGRLQPDRAVQPGRGEQDRRESTFSLGPGTYLPKPTRHGLARPRARARHRRPAAHPDALLHRARTPRRRARRSSGRCSSSASSTC